IGSVELSHLRIVKTGSGAVSLGAGGEDVILPGFTGGARGSPSSPEHSHQEPEIAALNERLGGSLTDADKVWVQQTFEFAAEDSHIQQAAAANTEENFAFVFDKKLEGLVLHRHDQNADLIGRVFKDAETTEFFTALARKMVYALARGLGEAG